jgi:molybdenum cofactor guanylyltransferase
VLSAVILAGGRSVRMGTPKALLPFDGQPAIRHVVGVLEPLFADIVVVATTGLDLPPMPVTVVRDDVPYQGPVAGILHGLKASREDAAFVTSCDAVFLRPELIAHLVSLHAGFDAVVPRWQGRLQPLVAVYRRLLVPVLARRVAQGELRLGDLVEAARTRYVEDREVRRFDPDGASFFNMNSPGDYAEALKRWRAGP